MMKNTRERKVKRNFKIRGTGKMTISKKVTRGRLWVMKRIIWIKSIKNVKTVTGKNEKYLKKENIENVEHESNDKGSLKDGKYRKGVKRKESVSDGMKHPDENSMKVSKTANDEKFERKIDDYGSKGKGSLNDGKYAKGVKNMESMK